MIGRAVRSLYVGSAHDLRFGVPTLWAQAMGLKPGQRVEVLFDEVLVLVPRKSSQAQRVIKAMRGNR